MPIKFEKQWGPDQLRRWMDSVESAINKIQPINGTSILVNDTPNGRTIDFSPTNPGDGSNGGGSGSGTAPQFAIGTVTTGEPGTDAIVTIENIDGVWTINLTIPRGDEGEKGDKGDKGDDGAPGIGIKGDKGDPGPSPSGATASCDGDEIVIDFIYPPAP